MGGRVIDIHEKNKWEYCLAQVFNLCKKFVFVLLHVIFLSGRGGLFLDSQMKSVLNIVIPYRK